MSIDLEARCSCGHLVYIHRDTARATMMRTAHNYRDHICTAKCTKREHDHDCTENCVLTFNRYTYHTVGECLNEKCKCVRAPQ